MNPSNQISVIGNVGEAPASKTKTKSGKNVVAFAVAQNVMGIDPQSGERVQRDLAVLRDLLRHPRRPGPCQRQEGRLGPGRRRAQGPFLHLIR